MAFLVGVSLQRTRGRSPPPDASSGLARLSSMWLRFFGLPALNRGRIALVTLMLANSDSLPVAVMGGSPTRPGSSKIVGGSSGPRPSFHRTRTVAGAAHGEARLGKDGSAWKASSPLVSMSRKIVWTWPCVPVERCLRSSATPPGLCSCAASSSRWPRVSSHSKPPAASRPSRRLPWQPRDCPVAVVNPAQVRAFAKAIGQRAKTDPIDAAVMANFARGHQARTATVA